MVTEIPTKTDTVMINKDVHFEQISQILNITTEHLRDLNPQYRHDIINGLNKPMAVRLPATLVGTFIDKEDSIYNFKPNELLLKRETVEINEEETTISHRRATSYQSKKTTSRNKKSNRRGKKRGKQNGNKSVTIKNGDTLSEIAARNHTTVKKLRKLNNISGNNIRAGKKLKVK